MNENEASEFEQDKEKALRYFQEITESSNSVVDLIKPVLAKLKSGELDISNGLSLLDAKNQFLLLYLINMVQVIIKKTTGKSLANDSAIDKLVELRIYLEKMKPIEQKLKYQIDKFVKIALTGASDENDPSRFKANPTNMRIGQEGSSDESEEEETDKKTGIYVPPKLSAVYYDGDESMATKREKNLERARKRAFQSSVMQELKEEYLDTPIEIKSTNSVKQQEDRYQKMRQEYEENYLTRLPVTKEDAKRAKKFSTIHSIGDEITKFEDTSVLHGSSSAKSSKKRKLKGKSQKIKKGKKKFKKGH